MKVLITDKINEAAVKIVEKVATVDNLPTMNEDELVKIIGDYDAILIRSQTKITKNIIEAGKNLKIIARAGVGVDNIDLESATKNGIIVVNSPDGNTNAASEHTLAMMLAMSRNIAEANASIKKGLWERSKFTGVEVFNKTLGIIGFGKIGQHVGRVALALGMNILVFDPYSQKENVEKFGAKYVEHLDEFWGECDFITVHTPKTKETTALINKNSINQMKKGVRLINCARGGIIDEMALAEALNEGHVASCAIDVFENEKDIENCPLIKFGKNVLLTPHLGASTDEAQMNVALDVANQVVDVLSGKDATSAVNIPSLKPQKLEPVKKYMKLAEDISKLAQSISKGAIKSIEIEVTDELASLDVSPLEIAILKGVLSSHVENVNYVNAPILAKNRGIEVSIKKTNPTDNKKGSILVKIIAENKNALVKGAVIAENIKRIVKINDYDISIEPKKYMLFVPHKNQPGMIASVATILGNDNINVSGMQVGQKMSADGINLMVINTDNIVSDSTLNKIDEIKDIDGAVFVTLDE